MKYYVTIKGRIVKDVSILYSFSLRPGFIPLGFTDKVLMRQYKLSSNGHSRGSVINNSLRNMNDHTFISESLWIYLLLY